MGYECNDFRNLFTVSCDVCFIPVHHSDGSFIPNMSDNANNAVQKARCKWAPLLACTDLGFDAFLATRQVAMRPQTFQYEIWES